MLPWCHPHWNELEVPQPVWLHQMCRGHTGQVPVWTSWAGDCQLPNMDNLCISNDVKAPKDIVRKIFLGSQAKQISVIVPLLLGTDCTFCWQSLWSISLTSFKKQLKTFLFQNGDVLLHPSKWRIYVVPEIKLNLGQQYYKRSTTTTTLWCFINWQVIK